jgi:hypothetical protein
MPGVCGLPDSMNCYLSDICGFFAPRRRGKALPEIQQ